MSHTGGRVTSLIQVGDDMSHTGGRMACLIQMGG